MKTVRTSVVAALVIAAALATACGKKTPPAAPGNTGSGSAMAPNSGGTGGTGYGGTGYGGKK